MTRLAMRQFANDVATSVINSGHVSQCPDSRAYAIMEKADVAVVVGRFYFAATTEVALVAIAF